MNYTELLPGLLLGLLGGLLLGYLLVRLALLKNYVPKALQEQTLQQLTAAQLQLAGRVSKEELAAGFVSRELYENVTGGLREAHNSLDAEVEANRAHQASLLRLTAESEQKLSKAAVAQDYVARESFVLLQQKLAGQEATAQQQEQTILDLNRQLTVFRQQEVYLNEKIGLFRKELEELHARSREQFSHMASEVLEHKKKVFLDENKRELNTILDPFKANLSEFREKVEATRKEDIRDMASLKKEIETLQRLNTQLSDDARNLATALKSEVKMQGNWGEERLHMILEMEGLQQYIDFDRERSYTDTNLDKTRRPDFILKLPEGKSIIIDSKVSLTAYVNYFNAATAEEKAMYLKQHLRSVTEHINGLADKNYQAIAGLNTPDYVFLFMPVEPALTLAMNQNPELFSLALKRKIVLITPTTLVATLKVVKILWQKENQVRNVEEIFRQCGELYNKFVGFLQDMDRIETALASAATAHRDAMNSLKDGSRKGSTIIGRFENIRKLEAKTSKRIPEHHLREADLLPDDEEALLPVKPVDPEREE